MTMGRVRGNGYGWALVVQQEEKEVFAPLKRVQGLALGLLAVTALLVGLCAWGAAQVIVKPLDELTEAAERMSVGELDLEIQVNSGDEIGKLAQAIERMRISLTVAMDRLRRA
jgi:methyl-accepting chemotaxis protein